MDANGAMRANLGANQNSGSKFVISQVLASYISNISGEFNLLIHSSYIITPIIFSQIGAAVMLQCPLNGHIVGANAGYLYGVITC